MSAPSDGARADARKARLAIADTVGIFAHLQPGAVSERVSGLADLIVADTDEPMWSAVVIAKHILASDWLAGVIADAKAEAVDARWNTAVDWLLNAVNANDFTAPFWAFYDGIITEGELRAESVSVDEIERRRSESGR